MPETTETRPAPAGASRSRSRELAAFLRARREALPPERLGLPRFGRRRTPGLRREEVAQLARVGVTWYTWLEQGRDIQPSARALEAIAGALQCSPAETQHLLALAGHGPAPSGPASCRQLSRAGQAILDQLEPLPAVLQSARFDVVGCNRAYSALVGVDLDAVPEADRNCIYLALTHPAWRSRLADWAEELPRMAALFRASRSDHLDDPLWERQLQRYLAASPDFREAWERYEVRGVENRVKRFAHPSLGILHLVQTHWWSAPRDGDRLLVYVPADEAAAQALARLVGAGGRGRSPRRRRR